MSEKNSGGNNFISEEVQKKIYDEGLSPALKEVGKIGGDLAKTARLLLLPMQLAAKLQDRVENMLIRIDERVPEERRIQSPPELAGPALEHMAYVDEGTPLWQMFEELLARSVDKDEIAKVHPSFAHIISQLTRDEAVVLYHLKDREFSIIDTMDKNDSKRIFENRVVEKSDIPSDDLYMPEQIMILYLHLESLGLVTWTVDRQEVIKDKNEIQTGIRRYTTMKLTSYGKAFVEASVPTNGFTEAVDLHQ